MDPEPEEYDTTMSQPPMTQPMSPVFNNHYDGHQAAMEGDESDDDESTGDDGQGHETEAYLHNHDVGDVEANCRLQEGNDTRVPPPPGPKDEGFHPGQHEGSRPMDRGVGFLPVLTDRKSVV